jgi:hypothetical protein
LNKNVNYAVRGFAAFLPEAERAFLLSECEEEDTSLHGAATPTPLVAVGVSEGLSWALKKPQRLQGYGKPLYDLLKAAHIAGKEYPRAREVLDAWKKNTPPDLSEVTNNGLKYYDKNGNTKPADLDAIRKAISRMVEPLSARQSR